MIPTRFRRRPRDFDTLSPTAEPSARYRVRDQHTRERANLSVVAVGVMRIAIAGRTIEAWEVLDILRGYPRSSILLYDLAGDPDTRCSQKTASRYRISGRLTALNARLDSNDAARLLDPELELPWGLVPHDAQLEDADPEIEDGLYDSMEALYEALREITGIDVAKASKLLHLKRPSAFPVLDSRVLDFYSRAAALAATESTRFLQTRRALYGQATRQDLIANHGALHRLRDEAAAHEPLMTRLPRLPLLDIIAWRLESR